MKRAILSGLLALSLLGLAPNQASANYHDRAATPIWLDGDPDEPHVMAPTGGHHDVVSSDDYSSLHGQQLAAAKTDSGFWVRVAHWIRRFAWLVR